MPSWPFFRSYNLPRKDDEDGGGEGDGGVGLVLGRVDGEDDEEAREEEGDGQHEVVHEEGEGERTGVAGSCVN